MKNKFVTFEDTIRDTVHKSENCNLSKIKLGKHTRYDEIPGYNIENNKIYRINKYIWKEEDWENYNYWLKKFTDVGKLSRRHFLIMAAWNQAHYQKPPPWVVL